MNKHLKSLGFALLPVALASAAMAQTSPDITVYGRANVSVEQQKVGNTKDSALVDNSSRFGLRAKHQLPDGLSVGMTLEGGARFNNGGTTGDLFAREATVHLAGAFGQITAGNLPASAAYFATADFISNHNHDTGSSSDAFYDFIATQKNSVAYASPKFNGMQFEAQYGLKTGTGYGAVDTGTHNPINLALNYESGNLGLGLGYERGDNWATGSTADAASQLTARLAYSMGAVGLGAYVQRSNGTSFDRTTYRLAAMYTMGKSELHANFGVAGERAGAANTGATQLTLGYNHNLDKQTKVYALYSMVKNESAANYNPGRFLASPAAGDDLSSFGLGIRYNF